ncbi:hypothetical protein Tco_1321288 [Tanacetum coccineum]
MRVSSSLSSTSFFFLLQIAVFERYVEEVQEGFQSDECKRKLNIRLGQNYTECLHERNIKSLPKGCLGYLIISVVECSGWIPVSDQVILMCHKEEKDIEFTLNTIKGKLTESITKIGNGTKLENKVMELGETAKQNERKNWLHRTRGIWMTRCAGIEPSTIATDFEGESYTANREAIIAGDIQEL